MLDTCRFLSRRVKNERWMKVFCGGEKESPSLPRSGVCLGLFALPSSTCVSLSFFEVMSVVSLVCILPPCSLCPFFLLPRVMESLSWLFSLSPSLTSRSCLISLFIFLSSRGLILSSLFNSRHSPSLPSWSKDIPVHDTWSFSQKIPCWAVWVSESGAHTLREKINKHLRVYQKWGEREGG